MKKLKLLILTIGMAGIMQQLSAQDIHFSQLYMTPLLINPAYSGAFVGDQRFTLNYRNQWRSVAVPYTTYAFQGDVAVKKSSGGHLGVGLQLYRDKAGDLGLGNTSAILSVAYHVKLNKNQRLTGGLSGGIGQRSIDWTQGQFGSQYDGSGFNSALPVDQGVNGENFVYGDFSGGVLWTYSSSSSTLSSKDGIDATVGASYNHFNQPRNSYTQSDERYYSKFNLHGKFSFGVKNTNIDLQPQAYYFTQGGSRELLGGVNFRYVLKEESKYTGLVKGAAVSLGGFYRLKDAVVIAARFEFGSYTVGFSYDFTTSKLRSASNGGFEIALRFTNPNPFLRKEKGGAVRFL